MDSIKSLLKTTYFDNTIGQFLLFFASLIIAIIIGKIVYFIFRTKLRKLAAKSESKFDDYFIDIIEEPLVLFIFTLGFWIGQGFLTLEEWLQKLADNIVLVLIAMTITWFIIRLFDMLINLYVEPLVEKSESKLDDQVLPILKKSSKFAIITLAVIIILSNLGYDIVSLLAGLGIGGLAIALAAQDAVKNVIGGLSIFWDKPFQIDDWVEISGQSGSVKEVGVRSTRIKTVGGTTVIIPNSKVADSVIENYSTRKTRRQVFNIGLTYDTSTEKMKEGIEVIQNTIKNIDGIDSNDIMVRFINFGAFSLDLEVVFFITDMANWKMLVHQVNLDVKKNLDAAGIEMAFPTETHYVINQNK